MESLSVSKQHSKEPSAEPEPYQLVCDPEIEQRLLRQLDFSRYLARILEEKNVPIENNDDEKLDD